MTVVTFRSKTEVFRFVEAARYYGVGASIISMPKEIKMGCGLAVGIAAGQVGICTSIISSGNFNTFNGIYRIKKTGGTSTVARIA